MVSNSANLEVTGEEGQPTEYEFGEEQNKLIQDMSKKMRHFSRWLMILGVFESFIMAMVWFFSNHWFKVIVALVQTVVFIIISHWTAKTASFFQRIVKTEGNDLKHLMRALREMRNLYSFQRIILEISVVVLFIASIISLGSFVFRLIRG